MEHSHLLNPRDVNLAIDHIIKAAMRGWGPLDLVHVAGKEISFLLFKAAPRVPARITSSALRREWLAFNPATTSYRGAKLTQAKLRKILDKLVFLPQMRDVQVLAAVEDSTAGLSEDQKRIKHKIDALIAKAESTQFEDEADALITKAQALRQRYRISEVLSADTDGPTQIVARRVHITPPWVKHQFMLLGAVGRHNGCASLLVHDDGIATVLGTASDVEHTVDLYYSLNRQREWFMRHSPGADEARAFGDTTAYRRSFILAYATRIGDILYHANKAGSYKHDNAEDATDRSLEQAPNHDYDVTSKALPVLARRHAESEKMRDQLFPNLSSMNLSATHIQGIDDGISAASRSHFGGDKSGIHTGRRQLAS